MAKRKGGMYRQVVEHLFFNGYKPGAREVSFLRSDIVSAASELGLDVAKNLGDFVYSFKFRTNLPESIVETAGKDREWRIVSVGSGKYRFVLGPAFRVEPDSALVEIKIPDATPGIIATYALSDEQALLAKLRYNRLIDVFTGVTCYSLQNHLRTTVKVGKANESLQIETDELYVGVDRRSAQFVFPVQAKGGRDRIATQAIEQDMMLCEQKFPDLICKPIAAQFMENDLIALFTFESSDKGIAKSAERHYRLVPKDAVTSEDLRAYRERLDKEP